MHNRKVLIQYRIELLQIANLVAVGLDRAEGVHPVVRNDRQCGVAPALRTLIVLGEHAVIEPRAPRTLLFIEIFPEDTVHKLVADLKSDRELLNQPVALETLEMPEQFQTIHMRQEVLEFFHIDFFRKDCHAGEHLPLGARETGKSGRNQAVNLGRLPEHKALFPNQRNHLL